MYALLRVISPVSEEDSIKDLIRSLDNRIEDHKITIARMLKPFFAEKNIPFEINNGREHFWFSGHDLRKGYVLLWQNPNTLLATHVLLLTDHVDDTIMNKGEFKAGTIHKFETVKHFLNDMKGVDGIDKSFFKIAIKTVQKHEKQNL